MNKIFWCIISSLLLSCSVSNPNKPREQKPGFISSYTPITNDTTLELLTIDNRDVFIKTKYRDAFYTLLPDSLKTTSPSINSFQTSIPLTRKIIKRASLSSFARANSFEISFDICIAPSGEVIYSKLHSVKGLSDKAEITKMQKAMFDIQFYPDTTAPKLECGLYTLKIEATNYLK